MSAASAAIGVGDPAMVKEARPLGAVSEQVIRLGGIVDNLASLPEVMEGRLGMVLDPVKEAVHADPKDTPPVPAIAPLATDLQALCLRLEDTYEALSAIARRASV